MTKLYDLPRNKGTKIYGFKSLEGEDVTIIFGHLDGMYSYCWLESDPEKLIHLNATLELEEHKDGYIAVEGK